MDEERVELDGSVKSKIESGMHFIGSTVETVRTVLISFVLFLFLCFIYNLFASLRDIPEDVFKRLVKCLEPQSSGPLISLQESWEDNRNSSQPLLNYIMVLNASVHMVL